MGGGVAVDTALEHPHLVSGLVVSGSGTSEPTFTDPWVLDVFAEWKAAEETRDPQRWLDAFLRFVPGPLRSLDDVDVAVVDRVRQMGGTHCGTTPSTTSSRPPRSPAPGNEFPRSRCRW